MLFHAGRHTHTHTHTSTPSESQGSPLTAGWKRAWHSSFTEIWSKGITKAGGSSNAVRGDSTPSPPATSLSLCLSNALNQRCPSWCTQPSVCVWIHLNTALWTASITSYALCCQECVSVCVECFLGGGGLHTWQKLNLCYLKGQVSNLSTLLVVIKMCFLF